MMSFILRLLLVLASLVGTASFGLQNLFGPPRTRARAYAHAVNAVNSSPLFLPRNSVDKDEQMADQVKVSAQKVRSTRFEFF